MFTLHLAMLHSMYLFPQYLEPISSHNILQFNIQYSNHTLLLQANSFNSYYLFPQYLEPTCSHNILQSNIKTNHKH